MTNYQQIDKITDFLKKHHYSVYNHENKISEYFKNSTIALLDDNSQQVSVLGYFGDIDILDLGFLRGIIDYVTTSENGVLIYRESTVNNNVFNNRMFPYDEFALFAKKTNSKIEIQFKDITSSLSFMLKRSSIYNPSVRFFIKSDSDLLDMLDYMKKVGEE
jgi:capsule polysaccharide export protein KpsC/LpsZ